MTALLLSHWSRPIPSSRLVLEKFISAISAISYEKRLKWFLRKWCTQATRSRLESMKKFVRTLRQHEDLLMNYFKANKKYTSGIVEGLNLKVNLSMRKAYGFRSFDVLRCASMCFKSPYFISLATSPNRDLPTNSSNEPIKVTITTRILLDYCLNSVSKRKKTISP